MSKYLTRDDILAVQDYRTAEIEVPEWGGMVRVRELMANEMEDIGFGMVTPEGKADATRAKGMLTKLVLMATIDENGDRLFTKSHVKALGGKSFSALSKVAYAIMDLSGLSNEEAEEGEDDEKNE